MTQYTVLWLFVTTLTNSIRLPQYWLRALQTIAEAVGDWYFERKTVKEVACPYPCHDSTCKTLPSGTQPAEDQVSEMIFLC